MLCRWTRYPVTAMEAWVYLTLSFQRRARFQPNLFHRKEPEGTAKRRDDSGLANLANGTAAQPEPLPDVQEVWFAGCHSDVGGGSVKDNVPHSLGNISLRWMVKQVILSRCGIKFDAKALEKAHIDAPTLVLASSAQQTVEQLWRRTPDAEAVTTSSPSGEGGSEEDMIQRQTSPPGRDVLAATHDQLGAHPLWWIAELMPMKFTWQEAGGRWRNEWR